MKVFILCRYESGEFMKNIETTEIRFFDRDSIPEKLAVEKTTREQILMCFDAYEDPDWRAMFD